MVINSKLIDEIIKRPCILRRDFKNSEISSKAWNEIQEILQQPVEICKLKWESLKSNYRKQKRKSLNNQKVTWIHYEKMKRIFDKFLNENIESETGISEQNNRECSKSEEKDLSVKEEKYESKENLLENEFKCGEIFLCEKKNLKFICILCRASFVDIFLFLEHTLKHHIESENDNSLKLDDNEEEINDSFEQIESKADILLDESENILDYENDGMSIKSEESDTKGILKTDNGIEQTNKKKEENKKPGDEVVRRKRLKKGSIKIETETENIKEENISFEENKKKLKRGSYPCNECKRIFDYERLLIKHMRVHSGERPFKCEICQQAFRHERNLSDHVTISHSDARPFPCRHEGCDKQFKTERIRKSHEILHTDKLAFQCQDCGKCFPLNSYLISHRNSWHKKKEERKHKCQYCDKTFNAKQGLKFHIYTHTGERPYPCPICPTRFTKPSSVKEHLKIHSGERNYVCKICNAAFNQVAGLIKHKKRHEIIEGD